MSTNGKVAVFVYGTLMQEEPNHSYLKDAEFVRRTRTGPGFALIKLHYYPAMIKAGNTKVEGEVYLVDDKTLRRLDCIEQHPNFYRRETITLDDGEEAIAYLMPIIQSGDWRTPQPEPR